jgi:hypothetical protein
VRAKCHAYRFAFEWRQALQQFRDDVPRLRYCRGWPAGEKNAGF